MPTSQLDTIPARRDVTTESADVWAVSFANALQPGESIVSASAKLATAMPSNDGVLVSGFVIEVTFDESSVSVAWTGAVLTPHRVYRLGTVATLNTGAKVELLTIVRCVD